MKRALVHSRRSRSRLSPRPARPSRTGRPAPVRARAPFSLRPRVVRCTAAATRTETGSRSSSEFRGPVLRRHGRRGCPRRRRRRRPAPRRRRASRRRTRRCHPDRRRRSRGARRRRRDGRPDPGRVSGFGSARPVALDAESISNMRSICDRSTSSSPNTRAPCVSTARLISASSTSSVSTREDVRSETRARIPRRAKIPPSRPTSPSRRGSDAATPPVYISPSRTRTRTPIEAAISFASVSRYRRVSPRRRPSARRTRRRVRPPRAAGRLRLRRALRRASRPRRVRRRARAPPPPPLRVRDVPRRVRAHARVAPPPPPRPRIFRGAVPSRRHAANSGAHSAA